MNSKYARSAVITKYSNVKLTKFRIPQTEFSYDLDYIHVESCNDRWKPKVF